MSDRPQEAACTRRPDNIGDIHSGPEGRLEEGNGTLHGPHHRHHALIPYVYYRVPHFDLSGNQHVPDDKLEEENLTGIHFLLSQVKLYDFFHIQNQYRSVFRVPACQVIHSCFLQL